MGRTGAKKFKCCFTNNFYDMRKRMARPPEHECALPLLNDSLFCSARAWEQNDAEMRKKRNTIGSVKPEDVEHWPKDAQKEFMCSLVIAIERPPHFGRSSLAVACSKLEVRDSLSYYDDDDDGYYKVYRYY